MREYTPHHPTRGKSGIPIEEQIPLVEVIEAFKDSKGHVLPVAKKLGITQDSVYKFINLYPEVVIARDQARELFYKQMVDEAEQLMLMHMRSVKENRRISYDATKHVLSKRARDRGWEPVEDKSPEQGLKSDLQSFLDQTTDARDKMDD